ncbi:MAG: tetratricopeptide repeat protein [Planctomycetota bacterium]
MRPSRALGMVSCLIVLGCGKTPQSDPQLAQTLRDVDQLLSKSEAREAEAKKALETLCPLLDAHSDDLDLQLTVARAYNMAGQPEKALEHLKTAQGLDASDWRVPLMLGNLYSQWAQWPQAVASLEEALAKGAKRADVRLALGIALGKLKEFDRAIELFTEEIEQKGNVASAHYNRAVAQELCKRYTAAVDDFRAALEQDDRMVRALKEFARFLIDCEDASFRNPTEALALADKAAALAPSDPEVLLVLGRVQEANGDPASGARSVEKALELGPRDWRTYGEHLSRMQAKVQELGK